MNGIAGKCQKETANCETLKNGIFYSYPKNSSERYVSKRSGEYQYETNVGNGDTSVYKVDWLSNCRYTLKLISSSVKMTAEEKSFYDKHKLAYKIVGVTGDYYIFKGYIDKTSHASIQSDTMWLKEKLNVVSNELIQSIESEKV
ncbi:MAG: hypothetical protein ABJA79_00470, partial [Parafilimonas sp.]